MVAPQAPLPQSGGGWPRGARPGGGTTSMAGCERDGMVPNLVDPRTPPRPGTVPGATRGGGVSNSYIPPI